MSGASGSLVQLMDQRAAAKEHALRQLAHLSRQIDYGYPQAVLRSDHQMARQAVQGYIRALDDVDRESRRIRRQECKHPATHAAERTFSDDSYAQWTETVTVCDDCGEVWR